MTTIRDIAEKSGYSISTISRALNHSGYVSATAQAKIEAIVKELNYVPNAIAQDLSAGSTHNIGVVLPDVNHPFYTQLIKGMLDAAFDSEYHVTFLPSAYDQELERHYLEQLRRKVYDGLIFTSRALALSELATYLQFGPVVVCEDPGSIKIPAVFSYRESAYQAAFAYLKKKGARHIAFTFSRPEPISATSKAVMRAYLKYYCVPADQRNIVAYVNTYQEGYDAAQQFVRDNVAIDYLFANSDDVATGARQYYLDHGLPVPGLVGQEHQVSSMLLNIPTIDHHLDVVGREAFRMVTAQHLATTRLAVQSDFILRQ